MRATIDGSVMAEQRSTVRVRQAGSDDVDAIAPLFDAYRQFYDCAPDLGLARRYLAERLERAESVVLVAEDGAEPVGFTQLYPTFCSLDAGPIMVLYDLYVAPSARRSGAGRALLGAAADVGRAHGASRLELSTARTNTAAQRLYEATGWVRDDVFLHYSLALEPST